MIIKFEPSGTHIHKGFLKARFDIYPDTSCQMYNRSYVYVPVVGDNKYTGKLDESSSPADFKKYQAWLDSLPHIWQLNPMHSVFVQIAETTNLAEIQSFFETRLTPDDLKTLDTNLVFPDAADRVSIFMKERLKLSTAKVATSDIPSLIDSANQRFASLSLEKTSNFGGQIIAPQTITIGPGATLRSTSYTSVAFVDRTVTASATGTISTWELYFTTNATGVSVATFFVVSGNNLSTRDYEDIGNVAGGSKYSGSGFSTDVVLGEYAGAYFATGDISRDNTGNAWYEYGDRIPCTNQLFGTAARTYSIYGTGTEAGGGWAGEFTGVAVAEHTGVVPAEIDGV